MQRPEAVTTAPALDVVVPVYNEQQSLEGCVRRLRAYLSTEVPFPARITIADNASTDRTLEIARTLADEFGDVRVVHLDEKGRGRALRTVWSGSDARVLVYMDVDLSTGRYGRRSRRRGHGVADLRMGAGELHRDHRRRDHDLRPDAVTGQRCRSGLP
ncbi:glycosyl transferase family 2 [Rhodococcus sp. AG1013]|nr:glycosyl transferase family 2 [Rhodococcus sp. AG1013]